MWFRLIILILLLVIAFRQSTLGLFSAFIMTVLTLCCAAAALGSYEWVAVHWIAPHWRPSYAYAVALSASFGVPLVALRFGTDKLMSGSRLRTVWSILA